MKNRTVCLITNLSTAEEPTVKNRLLPFIQELLDFNFDVTLVSADDTNPFQFDQNYNHFNFGKSTYRPKSFIKRAFHEWNEAKMIFKTVKDRDYDIYIVTIPSMFLLFNLYYLKKKYVVLDVRDLTWEYLSNHNMVQRISKTIFRMLANFNYRYVDKFLVTNPMEERYFKLRKKDVYLCSNGVSESQFKDLSSLKRNQNSRLVITYCGKVGVAQNLKIFIDTANEFPEIIFKIVGYGPEEEYLRNYVTKNKIYNVEFTGKLDWNGVLENYKIADILYAQLTPEFSGAMPSKLYQYLAAGKFIIYGGEGQALDTLNDFKANIVIPPNSINHLINAIKSYNPLSMSTSYEFNKKLIKDSFIREQSFRNVLKELV